jgi:FkbM family methyltransferase
MRRIALKELVPPIAFRAIKYINRKLSSAYGCKQKFPPFDHLPYDFEPKWILDIGANVGDVAAAALNSYKESKVICFEPVQATYETLKIRLSPFGDRVLLNKVALSNTSGTGKINITTSHGANSISPQASFHKECNPHVQEIGEEVIDLGRLDDYCKYFPCQQIDVMKIDVEGHELDVLKGGIEFISTSVDIIIIEISLMRDQSWKDQAVFEIFAILKNAGFRLLNAIDLHRTTDGSALLTQMDCIFRHIRTYETL